jgi:hypothetical protein
MTKTFPANIEISIRQLNANEDYDGDIMFQGFRTACDDNTILGFTKYFGFMPLVDISEIYIESNLYEFLISSPEESVDGLLEGYFDSVIELIEEELDGGEIKHVNTNFEYWFGTWMPSIDAMTFMPKKKSANQGACLYFGPAVSPEHLKQLVDGISYEVGMTCETSNECAGSW